MPTSSFFRVHDKIMMEYVYNYKLYPSNTFGFRQIENGYDGSLLNLNKKAAEGFTNNIERFSAVELDNGKIALMGEDTAFYYPNVDTSIIPADIALVSNYNVQYDAIRFHFISGYNFDDMDGFFAEIYLRSQKDRAIKLAALTYIKQHFNLVKFSPRPFSLEDLVFDKYVEILVPSTDWLLTEQQFSLTNDHPVYKFTGSDLLSNIPTIYCKFATLNGLLETDGIVTASVHENRAFAFSSVDLFADFTPYIAEDASNGYFKYQAQYLGSDVQEFIFRLNSLAGNQYYLIHELDVIVQNDGVFTTIDQMSIIQKDGFEGLKLFRPVIPALNGVTSLSINYTLRLYNAADGKNIVKTASVTTMGVSRYALNGTKINVGNVTEPLKIYNQVHRKEMLLADNVAREVQTKVAYVYVDNSEIGLGSSGNVKLSPFDNLIKLDVVKKDGSGFQQLDFISNYYMVFVDDADNRVYVAEFLAANANKEEGEIFFNVTQENMKKIATFKNRNFYLIAKSPNKLETSLGSGTFALEHEVTKEVTMNTSMAPGVVQQNSTSEITVTPVAQDISGNSITKSGSTLITPESLDNIDVNKLKLPRTGRTKSDGKDFLMP